MSIGENLINDMSGMGLIGLAAALFVIIFIDALIFPMLPELSVLLVYIAGTAGVDGMVWGGIVLLLVVAGEVSGTGTLYMLARRSRIPRFIRRRMDSYVDILLIQDERLILVNRVAPVLPVLGAFIAVRGWDIRRSISYVVIGGLLKYGGILVLASAAFAYFSSGLAFYVSLLAVLLMIGVSAGVSYAYRRGRSGRPRTSR